MPYDPTKHGYSYVDGELPVRPRQPGAPRTAQALPRKNYDPVELARQARHQAREEAKQKSRTNVPGEEDNGDEDYDGDGDVWPPRMPTSTRRYNPQVWEQGGTRYEYHPQLVHTNIPPRAKAVRQPAEHATEGMPAPTGQRHHMHWLVFVGAGAMLALSLWIGAAYLNAWWINTQNDWTYTQAFRTFSTDRPVGHNGDSNARPSHFIVQNDNRRIIIIELPANDVSKAIIYSAPTLIGDGQDRTPATLSFQVDAQTGRLDLVLRVQDQTYLFTNNGTKFVTPQGQ